MLQRDGPDIGGPQSSKADVGQCDALVEGKMTAPAEPTSHRWHDTGVGDTMYYDILPLKHETIGGNR